MPKPEKRHTPAEALPKIQKYCAYQERHHQEVRDKLYDYGLHQNDVEQIITELITSGFLNEERYAKAFVGGKFRMKHWGKNKIVNELKFRGISKRCIQTGLKEIDDADYRKELQKQLRKKSESTTETNIFKKRDKVARFAIGKGYEPELVWNYVMDLLPD
jgi:regulatory protein